MEKAVQILKKKASWATVKSLEINLLMPRAVVMDVVDPLYNNKGKMTKTKSTEEAKFIDAEDRLLVNPYASYEPIKMADGKVSIQAHLPTFQAGKQIEKECVTTSAQDIQEFMQNKFTQEEKIKKGINAVVNDWNKAGDPANAGAVTKSKQQKRRPAGGGSDAADGKDKDGKRVD